MQDSKILKIVAKAIDAANEAGKSWPEFVERDLRSAGVELHEEQPEDNDHDCIVRLADGREVYAETDGSHTYCITNTVREYTLEIDGGEGGTTTVKARNFFEAGKLAEAWAKAGEWKTSSAVNVHITNHHQTEQISIEVKPCKS